MPTLLHHWLPSDRETPSAILLDRFLDYIAAGRIALYPAQENAILELFDARNVILNTPTGSGKSLVATALHFQSVAQGRRSVYTCPVKALVNEKWLALCREFGPKNVGLSTGDASVNPDAPRGAIVIFAANSAATKRARPVQRWAETYRGCVRRGNCDDARIERSSQ